VASGRKNGNAAQLAAIREIADRTEGRPHQSVNLEASFSIADQLNAARARVKAMKEKDRK
jgi:hypothetical protein